VARFFFNLIETGRYDNDDEGIELPGFDEVRAAVMKALPDIAREEIPGDGDHRSLVLLVTNDAGTRLFRDLEFHRRSAAAEYEPLNRLRSSLVRGGGLDNDLPTPARCGHQIRARWRRTGLWRSSQSRPQTRRTRKALTSLRNSTYPRN
jgi:hypothetical protein